MSNSIDTVAANPVATSPSPRAKNAPLRVLLLENIHSSALELFRAEGFYVDALDKALTEDELVRRIGEYDVLGIRSKTRVTERVLSAAPRLITVGCFCIGTNQVELGVANRLGIPVFNAPFSNTRSVAELVLCEIVILSRRIVDRVREMHAGDGRRSRPAATRCTRAGAASST
ncbi:MAG TPA: hypothetical protein VHC69_04040 [Polyangiaceae bacterium]|nr:hypothetical protein [Polyangiaceae bacterium]